MKCSLTEEGGRSLQVDEDSSMNSTDEGCHENNSTVLKNPFLNSTRDFLKVWREALSGPQYIKPSVSFLVFNRVGKSIRDLGHNYTDTQCISKMYYFMRRYKQVCIGYVPLKFIAANHFSFCLVNSRSMFVCLFVLLLLLCV